MAMSRRGFLGWTVGAIVMRPPLTRIVPSARCVILDLGTACCLPESIAGYEAAPGAGFASQRDFRAHRAALRDALEIEVDTPVSLWLDSSARGAPYVDFTWPISTKIRDFSRVVPQRTGAGNIIAQVNGLPVARVQRRRRGTLIMLGTPIGPALWAGDAEARRWLQAVAGTWEALSS